ncbi:exosome catalytic subunit dis3, partial [Teratosphaeriaceae sp. CCFEE 6253]
MISLKRSHATTGATTTLSSKTYLRTLKSGKVQKVVRELYLRQDIPCSSKLCTACLNLAPAGFHRKNNPFVLSATPAASQHYPQGHYLVPDTNAFLSAMDLFEMEGDVFQDVIVLQTVLEEVKNRSLPLYNRLIALTKNEGKRFYVFFNEFRLDTYVQRDAGETINDRNDRAVRKASVWYSEHLRQAVNARKSAKCPAIVMLSDDKDCLRKAKAEGIVASNLEGYVSGLPDADRLLDMVTASRERRVTKQSAAEMLYPEYMSVSAMLTGVKNGTLHQGVFNVSPYNYLEGSVHVPTFDRSLIIQGRENSNRSVSGDVVVIEVLPKDQWKAPSSRVIEEEDFGKDENAEIDEDSPEAVVSEREKRALQDEVKKAHGKTAEGQKQPTARVVGVVKRNWRQYVGHIDKDSVRSRNQESCAQQTVFLIPMDKRVPKIRVRTRQAQELLGKRVLVTIDTWDRESRYPVGHFIRSLGELETKGAETEALLLEWDVQYRPFPKT